MSKNASFVPKYKAQNATIVINEFFIDLNILCLSPSQKVIVSIITGTRSPKIERNNAPIKLIIAVTVGKINAKKTEKK